MAASDPKAVICGPTAQPSILWRVVVARKPDSNGVLRETRIIELADERDTDAMGVQRWQQLTAKSPQSQWMTVCEAALNLIFERTT